MSTHYSPQTSLPVEPACALPHPSSALRLASSLTPLNECLEGGIPFGNLSEWGLPLGFGGRELILTFLNRHRHWVLWVHGRERLQIYPPAWRARGVDLGRVYFARTPQPLTTLKPLFLDPLFKIMVLDGVGRLTDEDYGFLSRQARRHSKVIMVLQDWLLAEGRGSVWARWRLNGWIDPSSHKMCIRVLRGLSPRQLSFELLQEGGAL